MTSDSQTPQDPQMPQAPQTLDVPPTGEALQTPGLSAAEPAPAKSGLIAPLWHTLLVVGLILGNSFLGSSKLGAVHGSSARIALYGGTFITQLILILLVWFGIRSRG